VGCQALAQLKEDPDLKDIPLVVVTVVNEHAQGYTLGAAEYLQKPISREQLLEAVTRLLPSGTDQPILVVEDDEATREGLQRILESRDLPVCSVTNGREALEVLTNGLPALVLLDLMMPEMDGFQLMETFQSHEEWRRVPVIVLTAKDLTEEDMGRLQKPQIQKVLRKGSYSRDELVAAVRNFALRVVHTQSGESS